MIIDEWRSLDTLGMTWGAQRALREGAGLGFVGGAAEVDRAYARVGRHFGRGSG